MQPDDPPEGSPSPRDLDAAGSSLYAASADADAYRLHPGSPRRKTREVRVGTVGVGGQNPVRIQSMTTTRTSDVDATVRQTVELVDAGCEIVRITAPTVRDARALGAIRGALRSRGVNVPLVADIHFLPAAALEAAQHVEKVRINPGNFADRKLFRQREYSDADYRAELERVASVFRPLVLDLRTKGVALRIGANHGSLSDRIMNRYGDTPLGMVESALEFVRICRDLDYHDIILSMKASHPRITIQAYRRLADRLDAESMDYPIHLGVTEPGAGEEGRIKSAVGIGALLDEGIGDTVRVSLTEDPVKEIPVARGLVEDCARGHAPARRAEAASDRATIVCPWTRSTYARRPVRELSVGPVAIGGNQVPAVEVRIDVDPDASPEAAASLIRQAVADPDDPAEIVVLRLGSADSLNTLPVMAAAGAGSRVGFVVSLPQSEARNVRLPAAVGGLEVRVDAGSTPEILADPGAPVWLELSASDPLEAYRLARGLGTAAARPAAVGIACPAREVAAVVKAAAAGLRDGGAGDVPLRLLALDTDGGRRGAVRAAARVGSLLADGLGDTIRYDSPDPVADRLRFCYRVLQATGARITRAEFVSCPSCGRTMFDLETTTEKIRELTGHLTGVRIAVMGCIVNGPGEMADAHFGYVGAGPGRINLFVGRDCVERNVPETEAGDRLVDLIRKHGMWRTPPSPDTGAAD